MSADASNSSYHHGDLKQALIEAACRHLQADGADTLSLRALAREVGVSQTAPYRHFESKRALFVAIAIYGFNLMAVDLRAARDACAGDVAKATRQVGLAYVEWALLNPEKYQLFFDSSLVQFGGTPDLQEAGTNAFDVLLELVRNGQAQGLYVPDVPPEQLAATLWSCVHGMTSLIQKHDLQDMAGRMNESVPRALRALIEEKESVMDHFINSIKVTARSGG